jgi:hypothetical protein
LKVEVEFKEQSGKEKGEEHYLNVPLRGLPSRLGEASHIKAGDLDLTGGV